MQAGMNSVTVITKDAVFRGMHLLISMTKRTLLCCLFYSRSGLSARQPLFGTPASSHGGQSDQMAINIESGTAYDLDEDIQDLRKSVGRLKQVSMAIQEENHLTRQIMEGLVRTCSTCFKNG